MESQLSVIGTSARRIEGALKVTGAARFGADASAPDMLWCRFVRSPLPHARIRSIDTARALGVEGVRAVITAQDIPARLWGRRLQDVPVLARDRVRFIGEKVAAVAAEDPDIAERAAALVEVDYEELPAVFDAETGSARRRAHPSDRRRAIRMRPASWGDQPNVQSWVTLAARRRRTRHGRGRSRDRARVSDTSRCTRATSSRTRTSSAPTQRAGAASLPNKMPMRSRELLAQLLDLPEDAIDIHPSYIGGDFGGKGSLDGPARRGVSGAADASACQVRDAATPKSSPPPIRAIPA